MEILHVADFHGRKAWFSWLAERAEDYAAVCLSGDLINLFPGAEGSIPDQRRWCAEWLAAWPACTPLFVCTGNHDWWCDESGADVSAEGRWLRLARRRGVSVDGDLTKLGGLTFVCLPWLTPPTVPGADPVVLLAHAPPAGTAVARDRGQDGWDNGDFELGELVSSFPEGSFVLSGHVHEPARWFARTGYGRIGTYCFNPGCDFSQSTPNHIEISTLRRRAVFHGFGRRIGPISLG